MSYLLRNADFAQTPLRNAVLDKRPSDPEHAVEGQIIFNTVDKEAKLYKDDTWQPFGGGGGAPIGSIFMWLAAAIPDGYLKLDGSVVNIADYPDLFALWGTTYGGNGTTTFGLPDWREYSPVGMSANAPYNTLNAAIGAKTSDALLAHTHSVDHNHASVTSGAGSSHSHSINHDHAAVTSGGQSANHTHTWSGTSGNASAGHTHSVSGTTGGGGAHSHGVRYRQSSATVGTNLIFLRRNDSNDDYDGTDSDGAIGVANHTHSFSATSGGQSANHTHSVSGTTAANSVGHTHSVNLPALTGTSGAEAAHTHAVDLPNFSGTSGSAGSGTSFGILDPKRVCHFIVRGK